jgi:hypothetical protein
MTQSDIVLLKLQSFKIRFIAGSWWSLAASQQWVVEESWALCNLCCVWLACRSLTDRTECEHSTAQYVTANLVASWHITAGMYLWIICNAKKNLSQVVYILWQIPSLAFRVRVETLKCSLFWSTLVVFWLIWYDLIRHCLRAQGLKFVTSPRIRLHLCLQVKSFAIHI